MKAAHNPIFPCAGELEDYRVILGKRGCLALELGHGRYSTRVPYMKAM